MMLQQLIIYFLLLLQHSVAWAGSLDEVISGLNILAQDCNEADEDVQAINIASGLLDVQVRSDHLEEQSCGLLIDVRQKISEDVQSIVNGIEIILSNGQGLAATAVVAQEEQLTDGFNDVSGL